MKRALPCDVQQLVTMMHEFHAEFGYSLNHQFATEAFVALLADDRLGYVWFIQKDDQNVGYVVLTLCYSMECGGYSGFVDDLFFRLPFRRAGLATAALREVRAFCVNHGVRAIHVETGRDNTAAQSLYRRVGFKHSDRQLLTLRLTTPTHEE